MTVSHTTAAPGSAGSTFAGFDFTSAMRRICTDATARMPELRHIQLDQVAISFAQSRKSVRYGLQASLTPLRFEQGARCGVHAGRRVTVQRIFDRCGREQLYLLCFYLPRFMDLDFHEKLVTIFHELWHISPAFDGDIRRHAGRCYAHSGSQAAYDEKMAVLVDRYLALGPPAERIRFLQSDFTQLREQYGGVYGLRVPRPKLIAA